MLIRGGVTYPVNSFAEDVREGLGRAGQKELPSKYLYDDVGSALFEVITKLPEYGLTRAEERILLRHSGAIAERLAAHGMVVELGSGSGRKTRRILEALAPHGRQRTAPLRSPRRRWRAASANSMIWRTSALWDLRPSTWMA